MFRQEFKQSEKGEIHIAVRNICFFTVRVGMTILVSSKYGQDNGKLSNVTKSSLASCSTCQKNGQLLSTKGLYRKRRKIDTVENKVVHISVDFEITFTKNLENFVSINALRFFSIASLQSDFLQKDVELWQRDEFYKSGRE